MINNLYLLMAAAMIGVFFIVFLMILLQARTQNRILKQKKLIVEREMQHQLDLARIFIVSQENERKRIGMDLHDEVGTMLSALRIHLEKMALHHDPERMATLHVAGKTLIDNIIQNARKIAHNLSPFMKGGYELRDGIEDVASYMAASGSLTVSVNFNEIEKFEFLNEENQIALYRIVAELLNNTLKHSGATAAQISFVKTNTLLTLTYTDNGKGIAPAQNGKKGMGMANIESRCSAMGATYAIAETQGSGFRLEIKSPITAQP